MVGALQNYLAVIKVVGIGGGGVNAVNRMIDAGLKGVEFIAVNTDAQSLQTSDAHVTVQIGHDSTRGLGSGSDPDLGRTALSRGPAGARTGCLMDRRDRARERRESVTLVLVTSQPARAAAARRRAGATASASS